mgnify:CR=1 FL=1
MLIYAAFATLWILVSDHLVAWMVSDPVLVTRVSVAKGWFFVVVTTLLLYGLIRRMQILLGKLSRSEQQALRESSNARQLLDNVVQSSSDAIFAKDLQGRYLLFNAETARIIGKTAEQAIGYDDTHIFPLQAALIRANDQRVIQEQRTITYEETVDTVDGLRTFLATKGPLRTADGEVIGLFGISRDITERKQTDMRLAESEMRLRTLVQTIPDLIWLKDTNGVYLLCNTRFEEFFGAKEKDIIGKTDYDFVDRDLADSFRLNDHAAIAKRGPTVNEEWVSFSSDGHRELLETTKAPLQNAQNQIVGVLGVGHNITARNAATNKIAHLAFYDSLTDLPNRRLMLDRLSQALASSLRHGRHGALLLIDLDNFKLLNDTLGHTTGDQLLEEVAVRLRTSMREGDTVARMGGDEFVVILEDLDADDLAAIQAEHVAAKILLSLAEPYTLSLSEGAKGSNKRIHQCTSSIGIALFHDQSVSAQELMKRADTAMYQAKAAGRNTLRFFDAEMQIVVAQRAALEVDLRGAIAARQFVLHYQAQVNTSGYVTGAEALVRWQHPERGLQHPADFLHQIEGQPVGVVLGEWVLETALTQISAWRAMDVYLPISVNISARQLQQVDFPERLKALLDAHPDVPPASLSLEVLETNALEDIPKASEAIRRCQALGVSFALDDFGTGYSSLTYLRRLPVETLKIDRSFVRDMLHDPNDLAIVKGVIGLAQAFGREVVAEGVETVAHGNLLLAVGCQQGQGYGIAEPMPAEAFPSWITRWNETQLWASWRSASIETATRQPQVAKPVATVA